MFERLKIVIAEPLVRVISTTDEEGIFSDFISYSVREVTADMRHS